jgi:hypothetical protein
MSDYTCRFKNSHICLFCGNEMDSDWDHEDEYFLCDCEDFKKQMKSEQEIRKLKQSMPKTKFRKITEEKIIKQL